jgi:hypothetical protein
MAAFGCSVTAKAILDLLEMVGSRMFPIAVLLQCLRRNTQLQRQIGDDSGRRTGEVVRHEARYGLSASRFAPSRRRFSLGPHLHGPLATEIVPLLSGTRIVFGNWPRVAHSKPLSRLRASSRTSATACSVHTYPTSPQA